LEPVARATIPFKRPSTSLSTPRPSGFGHVEWWLLASGHRADQVCPLDSSRERWRAGSHPLGSLGRRDALGHRRSRADRELAFHSHQCGWQLDSRRQVLRADDLSVPACRRLILAPSSFLNCASISPLKVAVISETSPSLNVNSHAPLIKLRGVEPTLASLRTPTRSSAIYRTNNFRLVNISGGQIIPPSS
jgi:hypothetical protein